MNAKLLTPAEITALSTTGQREYAKAIDVKRAANDTKATLAAKLLNRTLEIEKEQAAAATAAKPVRPSKAPKGICNVCNKRRAGNDAGVPDMCQPCADEGGWENTHNDNGHEDLAADDSERDGCWVCHPELNRASDDYVARKGSSKAGMTVIAKGDKISVVVEALRKAGAVVSTDTNAKTGFTGLVARLDTAVGSYQIECGWFGAKFHYPVAHINGKKFRNVSELFRVLGLS